MHVIRFYNIVSWFVIVPISMTFRTLRGKQGTTLFVLNTTINWQKSRKKAIQIENNQLHCCFLYFSHECCCIFSSGHSFLFLYLKILQRNSKQWVAKHHTNLAIVLVDYQPHLQGGKLPVRYAIRHPCSAIITLTELNYLFTIVHYRTFNSPRDWIRIISRDFLTRWFRWM